jgi:RND family efflux transporter MFP subunit
MSAQKIRCLVAALLLMPFLSCSENKQQTEQIIRPVRCMAVFKTGGEQTRTFSGAAKSGLESNLSFKVSGTLSAIHVKVGDKVEKGDLIAALDSKDYRLQVQDMEAALTQTKAQALHAKSNYQRVCGLYENRNASKSDLDSARSAYESTRASVISIEKKLEMARLQTGYTRLIAPFEGAISHIPVHENENVAMGTPIVVLMSRSRPEVSVAIPEVLISEIKQGDPVTIRFDALPKIKFKGDVTEVGVASSKFATTYPVTVRLKKKGTPVRPGMTASVDFRFVSDQMQRFIIPIHTVSEDRNGRYVFIAQPEQNNLAKVKRIDVVIGALISENLEILDGLTEGDLLITAGMSQLRDGMQVKLPGKKDS